MKTLTVRNPLLGILLPLAVYVFLRIVSVLDGHVGTALFHFQLVSATSLISFALSVVVGIVGVRRRNLQVIYVSLAFISLAGLFSIHGLATPGFILEPNRLVGVAAQLSVLTMAFWLMLSTLPTEHPLSAWLSHRARYLVWLYTPLVIGAGAYALRNPSVVDWVPVDQAPLRSLVALLTILMASAAAYRFHQSYRYSRFPFQLAMAYGGGWIAVCQIIITTGETFFRSWWIYHGLLLVALIVAILGLIAQYSRQNSLVLSVRGLFATDPRDRLAAGLSPSVRDLVSATESRDPYTAGHSYRVALGAVSLGRELGLPPEDLRALAEGGILHDVGKLQIPDEILNKPGPLNEEERKIIERHPILGYAMCSRLGLLPEELDIVRSHHERMDGAGYPDRLAADQIPFVVRILSVADVYDALTSARAYRAAWSQDDALAFLEEHSGTHFDPACVKAWVKMVQNGFLRPGTGELLG
jgi:putative nucleotidyltransferase with HDIG domain